MKKYILLATVALPLFFTSCNNDELKKLKEENRVLQEQSDSKDSTLNSFVQSFNDIEGSLSSVKDKESQIKIETAAGNELKTDARARIKDDIEQINSIMDVNKKKIAELRRQMKKSNMKVGELEKMIAGLNKQIEEKENEVAALNDQIAKLNIKVEGLNTKVDTLNRSNRDKADVINRQTSEMNTAYYVVGTTKQLKESGVISKEGGFIGIGSSKKLSSDFKTEAFTKIDITQLNTIQLGGKKVKIITTHPSSAYKFEGNTKKPDRLVITDYKAFWKSSKYLVIIAE